MHKYWLETTVGSLVELDSGRRVELRTSNDGTSEVWLCCDGFDVLLFAGSEARDYLAGLARSLGAAAAEDVLRLGRGRSAA